MLDLMEILIALLAKKLSIVKHIQSLKDQENKLKESSKKAKKSAVVVCRKK